MAAFERAALAALLLFFGCSGGTELPKAEKNVQPPKETLAAEQPAAAPAAEAPAGPPEADYPPACDDYMDALIRLRQAEKDAGKGTSVPEREVLQLNYRREAAKRDYDKMAEACAKGLNWAMNAAGKVPPPTTLPPEAQAEP
jgi:hypothetical protein